MLSVSNDKHSLSIQIEVVFNYLSIVAWKQVTPLDRGLRTGFSSPSNSYPLVVASGSPP